MELRDVALAYWRLDKWVNSAGVERKTAAISSLRQIRDYLDGCGIEIKDFLGQAYDIGLAVDVISKTDDSTPENELVISETLMPLIMEKGEVITFGQVVLGKEVKKITPNDELPPDAMKSIQILIHNINLYCKSTSKQSLTTIVLRWCNRRLRKQLVKLEGETGL